MCLDKGLSVGEKKWETTSLIVVQLVWEKKMNTAPDVEFAAEGVYLREQTSNTAPLKTETKVNAAQILN